MTPMSREIVKEFVEEGGDGDILDFLVGIATDSRQAITCLRIHDNLTACQAYVRFLTHPGWRNRFSRELKDDQKTRNRWMREFRSCESEELDRIVSDL